MKIVFGFDPALCHSLGERGAILADRAILESHGREVEAALGYPLIGVGEKTREEKERIEDELLKRQLGRDTVIVALGGGRTTDLVGFVASTYMRGVPLILIPTTLLGMVDAAIGGKTGIDTPFGKNTIGSFYLPKLIFIETGFLKTLPPQEMKNGQSEILKYGLIQDKTIWDNWEGPLGALIEASIRCKTKVVEADFTETGLRRILNFGHTVGHALELLSHFKMAHGEAVALGCMAESYLSFLLGYLPREVCDTILARYRSLGYRFPPFDPPSFLTALTRDKKGKRGAPRFVLIDKIGHAIEFGGDYCAPVPPETLHRLITWMEHG